LRLKSVTVSGFRSFGPESRHINLAGNLTAVVGPNASGKTAPLHCVAKIFGVTRAQRPRVQRDVGGGPRRPFLQRRRCGARYVYAVKSWPLAAQTIE
jgi:recombinational DNA repair ATPase RecF